MFAASDRPTVIYSSNKKLHYSNVNEDEVGPPFNAYQALLWCTTDVYRCCIFPALASQRA